MSQITFNPGDEVYHVSDPKLIMAVEEVNDRGVHCGWIHTKTFKKMEGSFPATSLKKKRNGPFVTAVGSLP